jgi:hypothetical protein
MATGGPAIAELMLEDRIYVDDPATFDEYARFPMSRRRRLLSVARVGVRDVKPKCFGETSRSASGSAHRNARNRADD